MLPSFCRSSSTVPNATLPKLISNTRIPVIDSLVATSFLSVSLKSITRTHTVPITTYVWKKLSPVRLLFLHYVFISLPIPSTRCPILYYLSRPSSQTLAWNPVLQCINKITVYTNFPRRSRRSTLGVAT